jgi:RNA polymerase sigma factor (sigma-70 family)
MEMTFQSNTSRVIHRVKILIFYLSEDRASIKIGLVILIENPISCGKYYICSFNDANHKGLFKKLSDKTIIEGIRGQDDKVLNYLYDHYFQTVKNHVVKNSGSDEDVSDVFQDTIIALYQKISEDSFTLTTDLKGYFFGIARNIWSVQLRHKARTEELKFDLPEEEEEEIHDPLFQKIMTRAFNRLKPDCQTVLTLFYDGYSYEEIAAKMSLKNETYARRKKYLCKESLMEFIKEDPEYQDYLRFLK